MLHALLVPLAEYFTFFNVFKYLTFRTMYATITALLITMLIGTIATEILRRYKFSKLSKDCEPDAHKSKEGTPTMGGLIIIFSVFVSTVLWSDLSNRYIWITLFIFLFYGVIGFIDDYKKTICSSPGGLSGKVRLLFECILAGVAILFIVSIDNGDVSTKIAFPFIKSFVFDMSWAYVIFGIVVIVGTANAVNLTDGLDGLATMPIVTSFAAYAVFAYIAGNLFFSEYLHVPYVRGSGELTVFCGAMIGAGLGFLWFNTFPATIFMGDVGSLSMGGALGVVACIVKHEILLLIVGGVFVLETVSVILQVASFKLRGKRLFNMAPFHHHLELKGWSEPKIIVRLWIVSFILVLVALSTLKLR